MDPLDALIATWGDDLVLLGDEAWEKPGKKAAPAPEKGVCRKCGRKVGRGIRFHEKACKGS